MTPARASGTWKHGTPRRPEPARPPQSQMAVLQRRLGNRATARLFQAKLRVGAADDAYEREADRIADRVVGSGSHAETPREATPAAPTLQPCSCGGTCASCRDEQITPLQRSADGSSHGGHEAPPIVQSTVSAPGRALDEHTRHFMEERLGHDFSGVRVHDDAHAASSASAWARCVYSGW